MDRPPPKPFYLTNGMVMLAFVMAILIPNLFLFGYAILGPAPFLLDREQFGHYANKARLRQEARVELQIREDAAAAKQLADRYVDGKAKSGYSKTLNEYRYVRDDNGNYELVIAIEEALIRVEGRDREHVDQVFRDLPFVMENPEKNILWVLLTEYLRAFFLGLFAYILICVLVFSRWHSAANTQHPWGGRAPVSETVLREALKLFRDQGFPFEVREDEKGRLVGEWRVQDNEWRELLSKGGLRIAHRVTMSLDPLNSVVRVVQTSQRLQKSTGLLGVLASFNWSRSVGYAYESAAQYGVLRTDQGWRPAEAYRYRFVPSEIVQPLANVVLDNGWTWKPVYTLFRPLGG